MQITSPSVYRPLKVDRKKGHREASSESESGSDTVTEKQQQERNGHKNPRSRPDSEHKIDVQA